MFVFAAASSVQQVKTVLSQLVDEGSTSGSKVVVESRYEMKVGQASATGQEHVSAKRRAQQDK